MAAGWWGSRRSARRSACQTPRSVSGNSLRPWRRNSTLPWDSAWRMRKSFTLDPHAAAAVIAGPALVVAGGPAGGLALEDPDIGRGEDDFDKPANTRLVTAPDAPPASR